MVKALVLYNSRGGNTKKVAMKIAEGLGAECRSNWRIPNLKEYDLVVVRSTTSGFWEYSRWSTFSATRFSI
ncbi:MAG: hypothetical protein FK733_18770, partial [Asgard group archaeon]|nr:hypothetical protein [Asgard group archaeon]